MSNPRRYPLEPLAALMGIELGRVGGSQPHQPPVGLAALAERLGISHHWAQHLLRYGLSERQADHYAVRIGYHASCIWDEWFDVDEIALERTLRKQQQSAAKMAARKRAATSKKSHEVRS